MSQELHYTSVARGLKPGSRGFGTVAATANLPDSLAERLEGLSGYRAVYPPGDPSEALNPVAFVHVRLNVGGVRLDVLSRIGPAGLDYSGRPNKYAHHLVLEPDERPEAGPAWLLGQPGLFRDAWQGEPRILPTGAAVPRGDRPPGIASDWQAIAGDAGWAGVLAESFLADPRRPVFLIFRPGTELLPLFVEAIALLPPPRRWDVEFSTYLTTLPPGTNCTWRGVLDGSAEARNARRLPNALIVNLGRPAGRARGGALVHLARTGERPAEADPGSLPAPVDRTAAATGSGPPGMYDLAEAPGFPPRPPSAGEAYSRRPTSPNDRDWLPDLAARLGEDESWRGGESPAPRRRKYQMLAYAIVACLVLAVVAAGNFSPDVRRWLGLESRRRGSLATRGSAGERPPSPAEPASTKRSLPGDGFDDPLPVAETPPPPPADVPDLVTAPVRPASVAPPPPAVLAFRPPDVSRSTLGERSGSSGEIALPRAADDRIVLRNASAFRLVAIPGAPHAWEVATQSKSLMARPFSLARVDRINDRTWRFAWNDNAKSQGTLVNELKDAVLELHAQDGGSLYVLLRALAGKVDRPVEVWKEQRLVDNPEPKVIRTVEWTGNPEVLDRSRWKPVIRRWKLVITPPGVAAGSRRRCTRAPRRQVGPPGGGRVSGPAKTGLGHAHSSRARPDPRRGEGPAGDRPRPPRLDHRPHRVRPREAAARRESRASRIDELQRDTPKDKNEDVRDPIAYRRERLKKLRENGEADTGKLEVLEREIAELKTLTAVRETDKLISRPVHVTLSLVIGLEIEGTGVLEIARIGDVADTP